MPNFLCISITFLDPISAFHGRGDARKPEWPPSPLRIFQALVAAASSRWRLQFQNDAKSALEWLQKQEPPLLIAPQSHVSIAVPIAVPNNDMDIPARFWANFREPPKNKTPQSLKTMKTIRATRLLVKDDSEPTVYCLWRLINNNEFEKYKDVLFTAASCITHVGWGVDMVAAQASVISENDVDEIQGERWFPDSIAADEGLRVPKEGTLDALIQRHRDFLNRISLDGFDDAPPLSSSAFNRVQYRRATDPQPRNVAAFSMRKPDLSGFRALDSLQAMTVAGMVRHTARLAANNANWSDSDINTFILGHGESHKGNEHIPVGLKRFAYLPLPSIETRGNGKNRVVGDVRRVLITTFDTGSQSKINWARKALLGHELIHEKTKETVALLTPIPANEKVVQYYTKSATSWSTITPVVLPGYDDPAHYRRRLKGGVNADEQKHLLARLDHRIDSLLRKAITQAGFPIDLANNAILEWRKVGFWQALN